MEDRFIGGLLVILGFCFGMVFMAIVIGSGELENGCIVYNRELYCKQVSE